VSQPFDCQLKQALYVIGGLLFFPNNFFPSSLFPFYDQIVFFCLPNPPFNFLPPTFSFVSPHTFSFLPDKMKSIFQDVVDRYVPFVFPPPSSMLSIRQYPLCVSFPTNFLSFFLSSPPSQESVPPSILPPHNAYFRPSSASSCQKTGHIYHYLSFPETPLRR